MFEPNRITRAAPKTRQAYSSVITHPHFFYFSLIVKRSHSTPRLDGVVAKEGLRILFPLVTPYRLPPHVGAPADDALGSAQRRGRGPDIEVEDGLSGRFRLAGVVVDDVADLLLLAVDVAGDVPVVTIKREVSSVKRPKWLADSILQTLSHVYKSKRVEFHPYPNLAG